MRTIDYDSVIEKLDFFRTIQAWPLNDVLNYKGWLDNFYKEEERNIAAQILDFFIFYPKSMINQMLKTVVGYCGEYLSSCFPDWKHEDFINRCIYSFIPGETKNPTDSGHIYVHKLKNELHIPQDRIVYNDDLYPLLESTKKSIPVIFVDDFVGSGTQCITAWNGEEGEKNKKRLKDIAMNSNHIFIYAPLIANYIGYNRIKKDCNGLTLLPCHIINNEYNLFDPECICWGKNIELYSKGTELILSKSKELGIPFNDKNKVNHVRGFDEQGLALAFENGAPDAILPIFYWCKNWVPLIKKGNDR